MIKSAIIMLCILFSITGCLMPVENTVSKDSNVMNTFTIVCNQYNIAYYVGGVQGGYTATPVLKQDGNTVRYVSCDEFKVNKK